MDVGRGRAERRSRWCSCFWVICGVGVEAEFGGVKSDFTDQEGLARRASRSSEGLVIEESVRIANALDCTLLERMFLSQCREFIAQVSLSWSLVAMRNVHELKICRAEVL